MLVMKVRIKNVYIGGEHVGYRVEIRLSGFFSLWQSYLTVFELFRQAYIHAMTFDSFEAAKRVADQIFEDGELKYKEETKSKERQYLDLMAKHREQEKAKNQEYFRE
jgi:sensor histidine kinase YesM